MIGIEIDEKLLRKLKEGELEEGVNYLKNQDGSFSKCFRSKKEFEGVGGGVIFLMTSKYLKEGRLFVRADRPFKAFE